MGIKKTLETFASYKDSDVFQPGAFNPGLFQASRKRIRAYYPNAWAPMTLINGPKAEGEGGLISQMNDGDLSAGVVMSTDPLLVACYCDDFDAVAMMCYPKELGERFGWVVGTRLLTVNGFNGYGLVKKNKDLDCGPGCRGKMKTFGPLIVMLFTDNQERVDRKTVEIPEELWVYTQHLGERYLREHPGMARNGGGPRFADARPIEKLKLKWKMD